MLNLAVLFFIIAIMAALFGFAGIAGVSTGLAQILFLVFVGLFVVSLILGRRGVSG